jgi:CBS domain-containing protein
VAKHDTAWKGAIAMSATVKDVMTTHVVAVRKNASFKDMIISLREHRVSAFPVLDDEDRVVGVVSEADMLAKEALELGSHGRMASVLHHKEQAKAAGLTAADLMTRPPVTIGPLEPVGAAARLMYARKVKRLPVIDIEGRLLGIVSRSDVLSVYSRPDVDIRHEIVEQVLLDTLLVDPARFTVTVEDGVVTIEGTPETTMVGRDIIEEIRHVEGVVSVRDRLDYPSDAQWPAIAGSRLG